MPDLPNPGAPINLEDINPPVTPAEPMFPLLANLVPSAKVRLTLYSLWALWSLIYLAVVIPQIGLEDQPAWLFTVNGVGTILFGSIAASNVPKLASR